MVNRVLLWETEVSYGKKSSVMGNRVLLWEIEFSYGKKGSLIKLKPVFGFHKMRVNS